MPDFEPFRGLHYDTDRFGRDLSDLAAPPYDVIDEDRLAHLRTRHEYNAVHLTLPRDELGGDRYELAGRLFRAWLDEGVLAPDPDPSLYLYRVDFTDDTGTARRMTGVIGVLRLEPEGGDVLPHERTMPKPRGDRLDLLRATRANLEPIWGLSLREGLSSMLGADGTPDAACTDTRGARHHLHHLSEPERIEAIVDAIGSSPVVIADGHHRYETSLAYRDERRAAGANGEADDWIMTLVVELAEDQLAVQPIHRVVPKLADRDALRRELESSFELEWLGPNEPSVIDDLQSRLGAREAMALVDDAGVTVLTLRADRSSSLEGEAESVRHVDSARFESLVAPALARVGADVSYRHDRHTVAAAVRKGEAAAAFVLRPADVPTIRAVAAAGERMPQKTTFFHPKASTGLVFRSLDA